MKKYAIVLAVFMSIYANAESNPFDLKENLQKIDKDQDVLLSALKEMSDKKEELQVDAPQVDSPTPMVEENGTQNEVTTTENTEVTEETPVVEAVPQKVMAEEKKKSENATVTNPEAEKIATQKAEEERLKRVKEEQARIEQERANLEQAKIEAEAQKKRVEEEAKLAEKKREEERLEVEAYEAKRLAKKEQTAVAVSGETIAKEATYGNDEVIADINITREELMEKVAADKAYKEAIAEMDQED